ncbi:crotonase/enoyl-CoA hydratase family protein [Candidatus Marimicrobium litorale]|jgi:enoyl-CoA hydratase|uniref:Crotonase/enoyl-CoA hydratase family protein n=1 Tax=Candidatus Marimicrobium litorale TaxID=2518991 RepID=A0ABT3T1H4_9GAMM|nr:crotonase/enoyl-CoA hydratase family protein [Candidatus Marimicrobium litorale]MCX2976105.1 crotonase/enoyl-CoA hydratase family protein [Candidatus Marimicrobium litorale]
MSDEVLVDIADGIMTVTLNRPKAKNAANRALAEGVAAAMDELDSNDAISVAIITGAGGTFCAGMDLKAFVSGEMPTVEGRGFAGLTEATPRKPLIAAVEGYALAGGLELAISCDLIVTADNAKFGIPEVKRGLAAAAGGLMKLPRQIPPRLAMEMALTGDFISAQRAAEMGLVNEVVPAGTALEAAKALAGRIVSNGPLAVAVSKQVILESGDWSSAEMWAKQQELVMPVFGSEDAIEGSVAFAEKRAPNWKGK